MIHHIDLVVSNLDRSCVFYAACLAPLGLKLMQRHRHPNGDEVVGFGLPPDPVFWIRSGTRLAARVHVAFAAPTHDAVRQFHAAGVGAGGIENGEPGFRPRYAESYFAAFLLDPDGNNIEAVWRAVS
jgi:catechol 2,3-dioxygenase-like lactoylglutathione lyase family enzyme